MKTMRRYAQAGLVLSIVAGVALAVLLCVQCVRTYFYVGNVLVPEAAERAAERQGGALSSAARSAGVTDPHALGPVLEHAVEEASDRVIWMRLVDPAGSVIAQAGAPLGQPVIPPRWWERVEKRENAGRLLTTPSGTALVALVPFRMPRPPRPPRTEPPQARPADPPRPPDRRAGALILEIAIQLDAVSGAFSGLRQNLVSGMLASVALLVAMAFIGLRARKYIRGKYLEKELQLARLVQNDLLPKPVSVSPHVDFAAASIAADHVGGDFHDIFETDSGRVSFVLGDASGKGVSAALLAAVIQGALRAAGGSHPETSCERINRMLCEKTATERFATLFWGTFDPLTATLRYVNAGHTAPLLLRCHAAPGTVPERLDQGGPVLGMLPHARYSCGIVQVAAGDLLVVYSDGINEAANTKLEEFGDERVLTTIAGRASEAPRDLCDSIMQQVAGFADPTCGQDDRTLMVVRFLASPAEMTA